MSKKILIDTRELPAPEPLEKVVQNLPKLKKDNYILMIHRQAPKLLFDLLDKNNYFYKTKEVDDETFEVFIALDENVLAEII